jgi:hypothetical protein
MDWWQLIPVIVIAALGAAVLFVLYRSRRRDRHRR